MEQHGTPIGCSVLTSNKELILFLGKWCLKLVENRENVKIKLGLKIKDLYDT